MRIKELGDVLERGEILISINLERYIDMEKD